MAIEKWCNRCERYIGVFRYGQDVPDVCERCRMSPPAWFLPICELIFLIIFLTIMFKVIL